MKRSWAERRDELARTTFAGQTCIDGAVVAETTVAPRAALEAESTGAGPADEAEEAGRQSVLFED